MVDGVLSADPIEGVLAGRLALAGGAEPVGKLFAVVGQYLGDLEWGGLQEALQEALGACGRLLGEDLHVDPAGRPIDGREQVATGLLVWQLGQVLDIDMHEPRLVVLERLDFDLGNLLLGPQCFQIRHPVAAQATVEAGAGNLRADELAGDRQEVVERQQQRLAQGHHHRLLGAREGRVQALRAVRAVGAVFTLAPFAHRRFAEVIAARQLRRRLRRFAQLPADGRGGAGVLVEVQLHGVNVRAMAWCRQQRASGLRVDKA